jgi:catechol 2,3-dioxygenase-like lactoylglutathione lyase family enzyme
MRVAKMCLSALSAGFTISFRVPDAVPSADINLQPDPNRIELNEIGRQLWNRAAALEMMREPGSAPAPLISSVIGHPATGKDELLYVVWIGDCSRTRANHIEGERMLSDNDAIATVAVKNLESAKQFYEVTLGLTKAMENEEAVAFETGKSTLFIYRSQYAGTNQATAVTFVTEEVDDIVRTLKSRGVKFEHYDLPRMTLEGDIHVAGSMKTAWFKDPDGNILSLVTPPSTVANKTEVDAARSRT